jgi:hypothetical protein
MERPTTIRLEDDGKTVSVFLVTDFTLHRRKANNPKSLARHLHKSAMNGEAGRAFTESFKIEGNRIEAFFPLPEEDMARINDLRAKGREIKVVMPPQGIPLYVKTD